VVGDVFRARIFEIKGRDVVQVCVVHRVDNLTERALKSDEVDKVFYFVFESSASDDNVDAEVMPVQGLGRSVVIAERVGGGKMRGNDDVVHRRGLYPASNIDQINVGDRQPQKPSADF